MGNPLSASVPTAYTTTDGARLPRMIRSGRGVLPSYASSTLSVISAENVTVTIPIGSLTSGTGATVTGSQRLANLTSLQIASSDTAQILFTNVSVTAPTNGLASHPTLSVTSSAGNPKFGSITAGQGYQRLGLSASVTVWATGAMSAGNVVVTATILLLGTALSD